jgi:hypothetical protein
MGYPAGSTQYSKRLIGHAVGTAVISEGLWAIAANRNFETPLIKRALLPSYYMEVLCTFQGVAVDIEGGH